MRDLARFGDGVVRTEKGVVFAPGVLPEERLDTIDTDQDGAVSKEEFLAGMRRRGGRGGQGGEGAGPGRGPGGARWAACCARSARG